MLFLLLWIVFGIIGALIAPSKNASPLEGGLFGILFGPLGVLFLACSRPRTAETPRVRRSLLTVLGVLVGIMLLATVIGIASGS